MAGHGKVERMERVRREEVVQVGMKRVKAEKIVEMMGEKKMGVRGGRRM